MSEQSTSAQSKDSPALMGQILVMTGKITKDQLEESLAYQATLSSDARKPLGQILLEKDLIEPNDIIEAIRIQMQMRENASDA